MGLNFARRDVTLPPDNQLPALLDDLPKRFSRQKARQSWVLSGPFHDPERCVYSFRIQCRELRVSEFVSLPSTDILLDASGPERLVNRVLSRILELETGCLTVRRLRGETHEELEGSGSDDIQVMEDFVRGSGRITRHPNSREGDESSTDEDQGQIVIAKR